MTIDQQQAVLERLDDYVRVHDAELWRTKQVSDFCGGIWAQVFGPPYKILLVPAVKVHTASEYALMVFIVILMGRFLRGRKRVAALVQSPGGAAAGSTGESGEGTGATPVGTVVGRDIAPA